jgi:NADH:ubiquinone oxidoreductase subunit E
MPGREMTITICMGSSCYSRGNSRNIEAIQQYLAQNHLEADIQLVGHLCEDKCKSGPNIAINGKLYQQVDPASVVGLLQEAIK